MIFHVMASMAQFERDLTAERSREGVRRAQARGVQFGAKHKLSPDEMPKVWKMVNQKSMKIDNVAANFGVSGQTIRRRLKEYEASLSQPDKQKR